MEGLTIEIAEAFIKQYEKEQSEKCWAEIQAVLKKYNRELDQIHDIKIILKKAE